MLGTSHVYDKASDSLGQERDSWGKQGVWENRLREQCRQWLMGGRGDDGLLSFIQAFLA